MLRKLFLIFIAMFAACLIPVAQSGLTAGEVYSSLIQLNKSKADTVKAALLLQLSEYYILKPGENKRDLDSSLAFIQQAEQLCNVLSYQKGICSCFYQYSIAFREKGEMPSARKYAGSAIKICAAYKQYDLLAESYMELAQHYDPLDPKELTERIMLFKKADSFFTISGNKERRAFALKNLADEYQLNQELFPAIQALKQALVLYKSINNPKLHGIYDLLGLCYMRLTDYHSALQYGLMAEQVANDINDTSLQLCTIYNRIGLTYYNLAQPAKALAYFLKSYEVADKYKDAFSIYVVVCTVVKAYNALGQPMEGIKFLTNVLNKYPVPEGEEISVNELFLAMYTLLKDYLSAQKYCDLVTTSSWFTTYLTAINSTLDFYIATKQYEKGVECLKIHANYINSNPDNRAIIQRKHYLFQSRLDSIKGNYLSALVYYQKYKQLDDSIFTVNKNNLIGYLQVEFETAKKDQQLVLKEKSIALLTNQAELQNQQINKSKLVRNITIAGILILAIFMGLLYKQYLLKQQANKEIHSKNLSLQQLVSEKEWLLKEVHHRVKNNLQTVVSLLESQSAYVQDDALLAIQDSQNRVHAMSLVHQKLYHAENVASINMAAYLPELVNYLRDSFDAKHIHFNMQVGPVELDVSQAIPVGLIVNEAITNAIKYAFTRGCNNTINIYMELLPDGKVTLMISDNGIGLPAGFDNNRNSGLGIKLMQGLTGDLDGEFKIKEEKGTTITVSFFANLPLYKTNQLSLQGQQAPAKNKILQRVNTRQ